MKMKILFSGGGTGGHVFPALAVIESIKDKNEIFYIGVEGSIEHKICKENGIEFLSINSPKLQKSRIKNLKNNYISFIQTIKIYKKIKPDKVFTTGGYITFPVLLVSTILKVPFYIHEQNAFMGRVNKLFYKWSKKTFITFENSNLQTNKNVILTGNPVRKEFEDIKRSSDCDKHVVIVGGSGGAKFFKDLSEKIYDDLEFYENTKFSAILGRNYKSDIISNEKFRVITFENNMASLLSTCDLIISRAGSTTLTEISCLGLPSIIIPSPYVKDNHQYVNGKEMEKKGASLVFEQENFSYEDFKNELKSLLDNPEKLNKMSIGARALFKKDARNTIIREMFNE
jgi:UDP-N-acetylglucosamine--N-acetylmuramyl-(pentapeptide) pyrophosphoryl-undecaprenol N-acetylglucosamine transferase